jgi:hypothetical protein
VVSDVADRLLVFGAIGRSIGVELVAGVGRLVSVGDDLGPVDQDPGEIRSDACRLVGTPCEPPKPPKPPEPRDGPNFNLDFSIANLLVTLLVIALIAAIIYAIVLFARTRQPLRTDDGDDEALPVSERIIDHSRSPGDWRAAAAEHLAAGRFREALRCRYRSLVGDLARRDLLDEIPGRTTGEEREQLAELAPASSPAFSRASSMFDDVWYGAAPVSRADYDRFVAEEDIVLAGAPARGPRVLR